MVQRPKPVDQWDLDQLQAAAQKGDSPGTTNAVKTAVSDVGQQLALASVLGTGAHPPPQAIAIAWGS